MDIFTRTQAARFLQSHGLRTTAASLATMATRGGGPRFLKFGRYAQYRRCDLLEWMNLRCSGLLDSTSTPSNGNTDGLFAYEPDNGDLEDEWDYRNTGLLLRRGHAAGGGRRTRRHDSSRRRKASPFRSPVRRNLNMTYRTNA